MVKWKPGMKNRQRPKEGEPAIVIEFRPQDPLFTTTKKETYEQLFGTKSHFMQEMLGRLCTESL